ncbi:MAG: metalloregulator ArsR/SmtB family transcription factor [Actinobacteria bacterium]|nr:metalloregulator ArsR/SmtB family transcription factor [Actinomycetota bacterium]
MDVTFRFPSPRAIDLIGFAWSPLFEAVLSLPAVVQPKRTPMHLPWARRCRDLPADLLDEINVLAASLDCFIPGVFEVGLAGERPAFADELERFRAVDHELVAYELSLAFGGRGCGPFHGSGPGLVHDPEFRHEVTTAAAAISAEQETLVRTALDDPATIRERFATLLQRYWDEAFSEEWERLRPRIEAEVTDGARALVTGGIPGLVAELLPEGRWDEDAAAIVVDKTFERTCDVADRGGMLFVPTVYGWPKVLIELDDPWQPAVIFPLRDLRQPEVPLASDHEVADGLRALGDETRLQITRMVAEQPRSTKELAQLLALSDSAVSRHLKILANAGVVSGERDGYFVLYSLRPERIGQLGGALRRTLGLTHAVPGDVPSLPVSLARRGEGA